MKALFVLFSTLCALLCGCSTPPAMLSAPIGSAPLYLTAPYEQRGGLGDPITEIGNSASLLPGRYDQVYEDEVGFYYALGGRMSTAGIYVTKDGREAYVWMLDHNLRTKRKGPVPPPRGVFLALKVKARFFQIVTWSVDEFQQRLVPFISPALVEPGLS